jgi:hypothetical protein
MEELKEQYDWRKGMYKIMKRRCNDDGSRIKGATWRRFGNKWYSSLSDAYDAVVRQVLYFPELYVIGG